MNGIKVSEPLARRGPMRGGMAAAAFFRAIFHIAFTDTSARAICGARVGYPPRAIPHFSCLFALTAVLLHVGRQAGRHLTLAATFNVFPRSLISR